MKVESIMRKFNKKSFLAVVPVLGILGLSASAFASSSGTATFSVTTPTPTLGVTITAPSALASTSATINNTSYSPDAPITYYEKLSMNNSGNEAEALNLSVGASSVTGTASNVITLSSGNNMGITGAPQGTGYMNVYNSAQTTTAMPLPANSFSVMLTGQAISSLTLTNYYDLTTTPVDFGSSNTSAGISDFTTVTNAQAGSNFQVPIFFAFGQGTAPDTYAIPINVAVSST